LYFYLSTQVQYFVQHCLRYDDRLEYLELTHFDRRGISEVLIEMHIILDGVYNIPQEKEFPV